MYPSALLGHFKNALLCLDQNLISFFTHCVLTVEMDTPSESYRRLIHLFHTDQHYPFEAFPFTEEELNKAGLLGDDESLRLFAR